MKSIAFLMARDGCCATLDFCLYLSLVSFEGNTAGPGRETNPGHHQCSMRSVAPPSDELAGKICLCCWWRQQVEIHHLEIICAPHATLLFTRQHTRTESLNGGASDCHIGKAVSSSKFELLCPTLPCRGNLRWSRTIHPNGSTTPGTHC